MKKILSVSTILFSLTLRAQNDSLPSGVYSWSNAPVQKTATGERRQVLKGSTRDLIRLESHTSTLGPGLTNHPPVAYTDREELIFIKEGNLKVIINDSSKVLGPGSLVLIVAGSTQSFQNTSDKPATYFVLAFRGKTAINIKRGNESGGSFMKDWNELVPRITDKGESRPIFVRPSSQFEKFDVHATALNAGFASHDPHQHRAEELILMIKGNGEMQIGQTFHKAQAGDLIFLESNVLHAFKNTGNVQCGYFAIQWGNPSIDK